MFKFKIHPPLKKLTDLIENLPYTCLEIIYTYRSIPRSFVLYTTRQNGSTTQNKETKWRTIKFLMVTFRRQTRAGKFYKMWNCWCWIWNLYILYRAYTPTCSSWTILFFSWKSGRRRRRAGGRLRRWRWRCWSCPQNPTSFWKLCWPLIRWLSAPCRPPPTIPNRTPSTSGLKKWTIAAAARREGGLTIRSRQSTVTHCH